MSSEDGAGGVQGRHVRRDKGHQAIRRDAMQDTRLSYKARGILADLVSLPDDWRTDTRRLAARSPKEGRDAIASGLEELERVGYMIRERVQYADGTCGWVWLYADDPTALADLAEAELERLGARPIRRTQRARTDRPAPAVPPARDPDGTFSQFAPSTGYPTSADPTSAHPAPGDPTPGEPESYRSTREEIPLPPSDPVPDVDVDGREDIPPSPPQAGGASSRGGRPSRAAGTSPRQVARAMDRAARLDDRETSVREMLERRAQGARARAVAATAGGEARERALAIARSAGRR